MNGTQIFQEYQRLVVQNEQYQVSAYVWYKSERWNVSGMNGQGDLDLVSDDLKGTASTQINAAEMELPLEFQLSLVEEGGVEEGEY